MVEMSSKQSYYQRNKEKIIARQKEWNKNNKEKLYGYIKKYESGKPWLKTLANVRQRCNYVNDPKYQNYGGKGVKCFITLKEIETLWFRDKASEMVQASIDRKDSNKDYTFDNCQFIEMDENRRKRQY